VSVNPLIVALDVPTVEEASSLAKRIGDAAGAFKIGLELYAAAGPDAVRALDAPVFVDLKLHDIPTTVARTIRSLAPLGVEMLTVHSLGGRTMLEAAVTAKKGERILAVTILTHLDDAALRELRLPPASEAVPQLARLAADAGCDGVVCAPADIEAVRAVCPSPFLIVTPGVRPSGAHFDEHARGHTPAEAMRAGADRIVVGRPITQAADPRGASLSIVESLR
jgi:orotidine-5'-phosphate decarboxylase